MSYEEVKEHLLDHPYTWAVTGAAGFIGSHLLETLLQLNQKVVGIDNFSTGFQKNLDDVLQNLTPEKKSNFTFFESDIRSYEECVKNLKDVQYVLHQAGLGSVPRSIKHPEVTNDVNVGGFINILRACKDNGVLSIVYASSSSVYGDSPVIPKQEDHIGKPLSPYAVSKHTSELYAEAFTQCYKMQLTGLRYFNVFGPRQNPTGPYAAVIPLWMQSLLLGEDIYINGDGETSRDFTFIENVVKANISAALKKYDSATHHVFNIAAGDRTSLNELNQMIRSFLPASPSKTTYRDFRVGDIRHSLACIDKAKACIEYEPQVNVRDGIRSTANWYNRLIPVPNQS